MNQALGSGWASTRLDALDPKYFMSISVFRWVLVYLKYFILTWYHILIFLASVENGKPQEDKFKFKSFNNWPLHAKCKKNRF